MCHQICKRSPGDEAADCRAGRNEVTKRKPRNKLDVLLRKGEEAETGEEDRAHSNEDYLGHYQHAEAEGDEIHTEYWVRL